MFWDYRRSHRLRPVSRWYRHHKGWVKGPAPKKDDKDGSGREKSSTPWECILKHPRFIQAVWDGFQVNKSCAQILRTVSFSYLRNCFLLNAFPLCYFFSLSLSQSSLICKRSFALKAQVPDHTLS